MSDQIETSISKLIDALRTSAPGALESAARAEYSSALSVLIIGGVIAVAAWIAAAKLFAWARKEQSEGAIIVAVVMSVVAILVTVGSLCNVPGATQCMTSPDYCAVKSLLKGAN
jgi:hypothetical protein